MATQEENIAINAQLGQSFFVDSGAVDKAGVIHITSIELFFRKKPVENFTSSGLAKPGVSLYLCPIVLDQPDLTRIIEGSRARVEYDNINVSNDASSSTKFTFQIPIIVATDSQYMFLLKFDGSDSGYQLWWSKTGETYLGTTTSASMNSGYNDGSFYYITNGESLTKVQDTDLKFKVNIAEFSQLSRTYKFKEKKYELFSYFANAVTGTLITGEYVYKNTSALTGTVVINSSTKTITGTSTSFDSNFAIGDFIVLSDGTSDNTVVRIVNAIANATSLTIDENPHFSNSSGISHYKTAVAKVYIADSKSDHVFLTDSNANASLYFANNDYVKGEDSGAQVKIEAMKNFNVNRVTSQINIVQPSQTSSSVSVGFANGLLNVGSSTSITLPIAKRQFVDGYDAIIGSKSLIETTALKTLFSGNTTVNGTMTFTTSNKFISPYINENDLDLLTYRYVINNDATNEENGEVGGNAYSKYVSKTVVLGEGQDAEDMRMFVSVYQPTGTSIKVYAKLLNSTDIDSYSKKNWTLLEEVNPTKYVSSLSNKNDVVEKEYKIPFYFSDEIQLDGYGSMSIPSGSNNIVSTTADLSSNVTVNSSLVRVFQATTPNNFFTSLVTAANSTAITVADNIANQSFNQSGLKIAKISTNNIKSAFINPQNDNIVRYYNDSRARFDTYKQFAIKIVMLSETTFIVPIVRDIRTVAVSAW